MYILSPEYNTIPGVSEGSINVTQMNKQVIELLIKSRQFKQISLYFGLKIFPKNKIPEKPPGEISTF